MKDLVQLRKIYGSVYLTTLPNGTKIPWKPLSIQEFLEYESLRELNTYPIGCIEDEIFCKCVLDTTLVESIDQLKAGIVSTVVAGIMAHSGPSSVEDLTIFLNFNRIAMQGVIHKLVRTICLAFPSYKPEELYAMDYATFMQRLALAEEKLLDTGLIPERMVFENVVQKQQPVRQRPRVDSKELFERQQKKERIPDINIPRPAPGFSEIRKTVISSNEMREHEAAYTGHERTDKILLENQMLQDTVKVYKDYVKQVQDGKKLVIPTHEERLRAAQARAKANEEKYKKTMAQQAVHNQKAAEEEYQQLLKIREKARARKARKARK